MKSIKYIILLFFLIGQFTIIFYKSAYAYIDPGTGSYLIQLIIAGFLGIIFTLKIFWKKMKEGFLSLVIKKYRKESDDK